MRVRFVVPTSRRIAPDFRRISGIRNPPPISTSSPRETTTSPPSASEFSARTVAAAQLFTTVAARPRTASAPPLSASTRRINSSTRESRRPRPPVSKSNSRLQYPRAVSSMRRIAASLSGARPRFVCKITPVALITRRSEGRVIVLNSCATLAARLSTSVRRLSSVCAPILTRSRMRPSAVRPASTTNSRGHSRSNSLPASLARNCPNCGNRRQSPASVSVSKAQSAERLPPLRQFAPPDNPPPAALPLAHPRTPHPPPSANRLKSADHKTATPHHPEFARPHPPPQCTPQTPDSSAARPARSPFQCIPALPPAAEPPPHSQSSALCWPSPSPAHVPSARIRSHPSSHAHLHPPPPQSRHS